MAICIDYKQTKLSATFIQTGHVKNVTSIAVRMKQPRCATSAGGEVMIWNHEANQEQGQVVWSREHHICEVQKATARRELPVDIISLQFCQQPDHLILSCKNHGIMYVSNHFDPIMMISFPALGYGALDSTRRSGQLLAPGAKQGL